jgi:hypothetical protein
MLKTGEDVGDALAERARVVKSARSGVNCMVAERLDFRESLEVVFFRGMSRQ